MIGKKATGHKPLTSSHCVVGVMPLLQHRFATSTLTRSRVGILKPFVQHVQFDSAVPGKRCAVIGGAAPSIAPNSTSQADGCPRGPQWQVHKFGGTCMATADRIRDIAKLVINDPAEGRLVVVSAMGSHPTSPTKVTDLLLNMIKRASNSDNAFLLD